MGQNKLNGIWETIGTNKRGKSSIAWENNIPLSCKARGIYKNSSKNQQNTKKIK